MSPSLAAVDPPRGLGDLPWAELAEAWREDGYAVVPGLLSAEGCRALVALYPEEARFRSRVDMARHGFGRGEYSYFARPLPPLVAELRESLYAPLAVWANEMAAELGDAVRFPPRHAEFLARCRASGQVEPTPLLLRYRAGDYNCLHRDLYGATVFPLQVAIALSEPGVDYRGGEFALVENRPRQQSRVCVLSLRRGDMVVFPVADRPMAGRRKVVRASFRHGVSRVESGERWTLGIIFHDAR